MLSRKKKNLQKAYGLGGRLIPVLVGFGFLLAVFAAGSYAYSLTLKGKIYPGVRLGSTDLGKLSYVEAESVITSAANRFLGEKITFRFGERLWTRTAGELGVSLDIEETLQRAKGVGRAFQLVNIFAAPVYALGGGDTVQPVLVIQPGEIEAAVSIIARQADRPASLPTFHLAGGVISALPGKPGSVVDQPMVVAEVLNAAARLSAPTIDLPMVIDETVSQPAELEQLRVQAERLLRSPLTLTADGGQFVVEPAQSAAWLTVEKDRRNSWALSLAESQVRLELADLLSPLVKEPIPAVTYRAAQPVKPVVAGQDGQALDYPAIIAELEQGWLKQNQSKIPVAVKTIARPVTTLDVAAPKAEGRSILIDLTNQTAFAFADGTLQFFARTSTGKYPRATPTGEFKIYAKSRRQKMSGPGYYLPNVQWVMFYNGDYSLHGTYWHNNFGHPMSHGCTNLSNEDAERFYNFADRGTPVTIIGETPRS